MQRYLVTMLLGGALCFSAMAGSGSKEARFLEARANHWAYQPLADAVPPVVSDAAPVKNDVDRFILHRLAGAGLEPSPAADRRTLIRRVTYDLTGLPPSPDDVAAFVADDRPDAYADLVERLLASPRYGERQARHWLDVVRYTDSFDSRGNAKTDPVEIWRYRDWVVAAMNGDMPYDRFVRYQIAGDLLPGPEEDFNREGIIATGMLAIGHWPQGDADKEKMVADIVDDQVDVVTRTFLGVTMACARCHDHKFDPFSTEEYYGLAGIFFSSSILPGPGAKTEGSPILHLPLASPAALAARKAAEEQLATLRAERDALTADARAQFAREQLAQTGRYLLAAHAGSAATPDSGLNAEVLRQWMRALGGDLTPALLRVEGDARGIAGLIVRDDTVSTPSAVANTTDAEVRYATIVQPAQSIVVHPGPEENVGIGWRAPAAASITLSGRVADADGNCGDGIAWKIVYRASGAEQVLAEGRTENGGTALLDVGAPLAVTPGGQILLVILPAGDYSCDTTEVALRITSDAGQVWDLATEVLPHFAGGNPWPDSAGNSEVWWLHRESAGAPLDPILFAPWWAAWHNVGAGQPEPIALEQAAATIQAAIDAALAMPESPLNRALAPLSAPGGPVYLAVPPVAEGSRLAAVSVEVSALEQQLQQPLAYAVGIQEGGVPDTGYAGFHDVRVHHRGDYTNLGDVVPRQMPAIVPGTAPRPVTGGSGRLELAEWLAGDCAPLLARVMVNRVWQQHFGEGLVRTPGDFGTQGLHPTHPELLDFLAAQFIDSGWSLKGLHRTILLSATYQQASGGNEAQRQADPENRLLARVDRRRLDAESLRDSLLAVSGQLDTTPGGPAFTDLATPRRTLYLRTTRSDLNTYTQLFDGADPTSIVPARNESTVSPQALFLMNNPLILRAAEALAAEAGVLPMPGPIVEMYRRLYGRAPAESEVQFAEMTLRKLGHPESPAALVAYAQVLLGSNEFCFVD